MPKGHYAASNTLNQKLGQVTLKKVVDYTLDINNLNVLDRVARYLLAVAYSSVYKGTDTYNQAYVAARTVAVGLADNTLYVTANTLIGLGLKAQSNVKLKIAVNEMRIAATALAAEMSAERIANLTELVVVLNPLGNDDRTYHAEMQLVDVFQEQNLRFEGDIIGVSKPCCMQCAGTLDKLGIGYSYWHSENVGHWIPCKPKAKWW
jgi:hypothetical protein